MFRLCRKENPINTKLIKCEREHCGGEMLYLDMNKNTANLKCNNCNEIVVYKVSFQPLSKKEKFFREYTFLCEEYKMGIDEFDFDENSNSTMPMGIHEYDSRELNEHLKEVQNSLNK